MEKHIAVISTDISDFTDWITERKIDKKIVISQMQIESEDITYHCVYKPTHTISMVYDDIVETKNARKNDTYSSLLNRTKACLKLTK